MNKHILETEVQAYINAHLNADISKIALAKSPFLEVTAAELANQISAKKKSEKKLPTWFNTKGICFPSTLSVEQTSSENTATYKQNVIKGHSVVDITAGFGVDSFYFAKKTKQVFSCEINEDLSAISKHNASVLGAKNITCLATDGLAYINQHNGTFGTVYVDPARRSTNGKVFKLAECTPNVVEHLPLLFTKADRIVIKTSPLLDLKAGLSELTNVAEIHIVSVKNECKELLWVLDKDFTAETTIYCVTINDQTKVLTFPITAVKHKTSVSNSIPTGYLYEPDVALMKSGAFDYIATKYNLEKLAPQSHLYFSTTIQGGFLGRIFEIKAILKPNELKKQALKGNVIVRNFPESAENLVKKYKISPAKNEFLIFTQAHTGSVVIQASILQYY